MLARKGSDSNRSKRYIFDVIVFSAKHKKTPLLGVFLWCGQEDSNFHELSS